MSETCQCLITVRSEQAKTRYWLHILKGKLRAAGVFFFSDLLLLSRLAECGKFFLIENLFFILK